MSNRHTTSRRPIVSIHLPRRQVLLFVVAVCLPCAMLLALGTRIVVQERELAQKRLADREDEVADAVGRSLLDRLERIKVEEATAFAAYAEGRGNDQLAQGATVFVALHDSAGPHLSWITDLRPAHAEAVLSEPAYAAQIARGARAELVAHQYASAADAYRAALRMVTDPTQAAYAELLLARASRAAGIPGAPSTYEHLLSTPLSVRDDQGVPFAAYAAVALAADPRARTKLTSFVQRIRRTIVGTRALSPLACYAFVALPASLAVRTRCAELDRAESLVGDAVMMASLRAPSSGEGVRWVTADSGRWLAGVAAATSTHPSILLVVRVDSVAEGLSGLMGADFHLVASTGVASRPIGHGIEGLGVMRPAGNASSMRRSALTGAFYVTALVAVLGVVLLGGYFLWRDVQRERRLAQLRSQFVASVSHELKTPLTAIRLFAETLRTRSTMDVRVRDEYLETIERESVRLTRLLQNVLDFSRIEGGERTYRLSPQSVSGIVEQALRTLRFPLEQQGFTVLFHVADGLPIVQCDADAVQQAVLNLVSNAIKYSNRDSRIDVRVEHREGAVAIVVRDYGVGIAAPHQLRLFEAFYRAPTAENDVIPGTGLGLPLVEHIAQAHGGRVRVDSEVGRGSTFTLTLPVSAPLPTPRKPTLFTAMATATTA